MFITGIPSGLTDTNCWVVAAAAGEQCVVIDPGYGVVGRLDEVLAEQRLHPVAVLLTHGHIDHTFSVVPVCQARDVPAYLHPADRFQLTDPWSGLGRPAGTPLLGDVLTFAEPADVRELADHDTVELAGLTVRVTHAPGHSAGSVTFATDGADAPVLFSGDLLFAGSVGRTDLPGGSSVAMTRSLQAVLTQDDATVVHPGHGGSTTIARERRTNPYLREL